MVEWRMPTLDVRHEADAVTSSEMPFARRAVAVYCPIDIPFPRGASDDGPLMLSAAIGDVDGVGGPGDLVGEGFTGDEHAAAEAARPIASAVLRTIDSSLSVTG
jgi:hypothetical protein